ncbi:MAG: NTPase [Candidatus Eisenbacteria bacterium]|nr:NTPase [Candidatus Eisenbacteria bacterium]
MPDDSAKLLFAADAMLGRLAKKLRMLGYDVFYRAGIDDRELKTISARQRRILLTRDRGIAETSMAVRVVLVESDDVAEQLSQVVGELDLDAAPSSFSRCTVCNVPIEAVGREEVESLVPPYVYSTQSDFARCPACGRIYWAATHVERAREWLSDALDVSKNSGAPDTPKRHDAGKTDRRASESGQESRVSNVFVTGRPGVGKTTLIRRVLSELDVRAGGFYTSEIRDGERRVGFSIASLDGERGILAHVDHRGDYRVGRYGVNREDLERVGVAALDRALAKSDLIVMDEIGRMELCSPTFQEAVMRALDSDTSVFGTIQERRNPFLDSVRSRPDVEVIEVTESNRDSMVSLVRARIAELVGHE